MRQQVRRAVQSGPSSLYAGQFEMLCIPIDDDSGEQVEPCHSVVLPLGGPVPNFALSSNAQGIFQRVMGLSLVETDLGAALHVGVEQPIDDEERAFDAPDLAQGLCQFVLARIGCELLQQLTGRHGAGSHGCSSAQDIGPVLDDEVFPDLPADQPPQRLRRAGRVEEIEPLGRQITDTWDEAVAQTRGR